MLDNVSGAGAEAATSAEGPTQGTDDHVDGGGVDVLRFRETASGAAQDAEGPSFVENEAEFVAETQFNLIYD